MYNCSSKCWFLLCLFIYPTHSEVTPGVTSLGSSAHTHTHALTSYPPAPTTIRLHTGPQHLKISPAKRWKNTILVWWRETERDEGVMDQTSPLGFYRTLAAEKPACSNVCCAFGSVRTHRHTVHRPAKLLFASVTNC